MRKDFSNLKIDVQKEKKTYYEHEDFVAGTPPFLRGSYSTMYLQKPIEHRILVNFPSCEKCNLFLKEQTSKGHKNFVIDFNLININSKTNGIKISTTSDIINVFKEINLLDLNITIAKNNNMNKLFILLFLALKELNISIEDLNINTQLNNLSCCHQETTTVSSIEILSSSENNSPEIEITNLLVNTYHIIQKQISEGLLIDSIASNISFNLKISNNHFIEIAKARAARMLWAKMIHSFHPKNQQSYALQLHATLSDSSCVFTAISGGFQSLTSFEPSQLVTLKETAITKTVDPWAGSNLIEKTTEEIVNKTWLLFKNNTNS